MRLPCNHITANQIAVPVGRAGQIESSMSQRDIDIDYDDDDDDFEPPKRRRRRLRLPRKLRLLIFLAVVGALIGLIISYLVSLMAAQAYSSVDFNNGLRGGLTIALLFWFYLAIIEPAGFRTFLKRRSFIVSAIIRALTFLVVIVLGLSISRLVFMYAFGGDPWPAYFLDGGLARDAGLSMIFALAVFFVLDVAELVGPRVLTNIILGRYHNPVVEDRVFLFLDVRGATALAERIGDEKAHEFLARFFLDIDRIMLRWNGEVVTYLGDGVMITWEYDEAVDRSAPLEFLADVMTWVVTKAPSYKEEYGAVPTFRAGLNGGEVVVGECGASKREIAYNGDVVNVAARLEQACKRTRYVALASAELVQRMDLPDGMVADKLGPMRLKGRERQLDVVALRMIRVRQ